MTRASGRLSPAARTARRLAVFGGSFDPPHAGHLHMAREALRARALDHVLWVPAAQPPHKPERLLARGSERVRMLELLLHDESPVRHTIWTVELEREGTSYTIDTLRELVAELEDATGPGPELFLILGTDNLAGLPHWRSAAEVLRLAQPIVLPRGDPALDGLDELDAAQARAVREGLLDCARVDVSSTELRERLASAGAVEDLERDLPPRLAEYLIAAGIYSRA